MVERPRVYPDLSRAAHSEFDDDPHLHNLIVARAREREKLHGSTCSYLGAHLELWALVH